MKASAIGAKVGFPLNPNSASERLKPAESGVDVSSSSKRGDQTRRRLVLSRAGLRDWTCLSRAAEDKKARGVSRCRVIARDILRLKIMWLNRRVRSFPPISQIPRTSRWKTVVFVELVVVVVFFAGEIKHQFSAILKVPSKHLHRSQSPHSNGLHLQHRFIDLSLGN